ncbi:GNAT family N-acetyltransferase [Calothrix sp. HK-06]|nr:GNAT family N-acetyltransferase [Calothrix sp. HK-06]
MTVSNFRVRLMNRSEVDLAIAWAALEGWNPGNCDAECFYQIDKQGFFIGELNGEPIGCISAVAYDDNFGCIGFYIVKPEYRGHGYGMQLWTSAVSYLGAKRNIGLDGVIAQQKNYKKSGFQIAYNHIRYEGKSNGTLSPDIVELSTVPLRALVAYDQPFFPAERSNFLQSWIAPPHRIALGIKSNDALVGYGVIRQSHTGFRVGPLFADSEQIAEKILLALFAKSQDASVFMDIPDANPIAITLAQRYGMEPVSECAIMYTKGAPNLPINRIFAVTTVEVG